MSADPLTELSDADRARLEGLLVEFDLNWAPDRLSAAAAQLPPAGPFREAALRELVKIDLERQARAGRPVPLRDYLDRFPDLADTGTAPPDLLAAEAAAARETLAPAGRTGSVHLPEAFGRYRIFRPLGRGGMGGVYLARDTELDRLVALKVPRFPPDDAAAVERFTREAKAAATIDHPNVCRVYDVGRVDGLPYISMAYIEGPTLADLLRGGPLPPRRAAEIARDVARALAEAHRQGVVHRDLKPANILLQSDEGGGMRDERKAASSSSLIPQPSTLRPVVTDFGLAGRTAPDDPRLTAAGVMAGTPLYMSPEQAAGDRAGPASDVYSLGVVLYEMAAGRTPFTGTRADLFRQVLAADPPAPSAVRPAVDSRLDAITRKALAKRPADRFATMAEFADALDGWLAGPADGRGAGTRRAARVGVAVGAAVLVVLGVAAIVRQTGGRASTGPPESPEPVAGGTTVSVPPAPAAPAKAPRPALRLPGPARWRPKPGAGAALPEADHRILAVALSPDGRQVCAATADGSAVGVRRWDAGTGTELPAEAKRSPASWAAFTADGQHYLAGGGRDTRLHSSTSGATVRTFETGPGTRAGGVSRDGRRVIVHGTALLAGPRVGVYDAESGALVREYLGHRQDVRCVALSDDGGCAFSASPDRVAVWGVAVGNWQLEAGSNAIECAAFIPRSLRVAAGGANGALTRYDVTDTLKAASVGAPGSPVTCLAVSPDGRVVVAAAADKSLRAWNFGGRQLIGRAPELPEPAVGMAFSADGARLVTAGARSWRVWDLTD